MKLKLRYLIGIGILAFMYLSPVIFAAVQGDAVVNVVDPTNSLKFTRVVGTPATGMRTQVTNTINIPVVTTPASGTTVTVVQPAAGQLNVTATPASNTTVTVTSTYGALNTVGIDFEHYQIHTGKHYNALLIGTLATGVTATYLFITPNTSTRVHAGYHIETDNQYTLAYSEGATYGNIGTPLTIFNNDRNSGNTSASLLYSTPSITTVGTVISYDLVGSGAAGDSITNGNENVLKQGTVYCIVLTNIFTGNSRYVMHLQWYEL